MKTKRKLVTKPKKAVDTLKKSPRVRKLIDFSGKTVNRGKK